MDQLNYRLIESLDYKVERLSDEVYLPFELKEK